MIEKPELSNNQERAIVFLLSYPTVREVSQKLRVSEVTLYRWLNDDTFRAHYRAARRKVVDQAIGHLQRATSSAVTTLLSVMECVDSPANSRITAASKIIDVAVRSIEMIELEERIELLEKALGTGKEDEK